MVNSTPVDRRVMQCGRVCAKIGNCVTDSHTSAMPSPALPHRPHTANTFTRDLDPPNRDSLTVTKHVGRLALAMPLLDIDFGGFVTRSAEGDSLGM